MTIAHTLAGRGDVALWARDPGSPNSWRRTDEPAAPPGAGLDPGPRSRATSRRGRGGRVVLVAVPTVGLRRRRGRDGAVGARGVPIVSLAKGFEPGTGCA